MKVYVAIIILSIVDGFVRPNPSLIVRSYQSLHNVDNTKMFGRSGQSLKSAASSYDQGPSALVKNWKSPKQWIKFAQWILVAPPPPLPYAKIEGADWFRTLGVGPNADYEEIQIAVKKLKEKYADDKKKMMKIDVAKDKIAELRLRQRMRGELAVTSEVAYLDREAELEAKNRFKNKMLQNQPKWIRRIPLMWIPPNQIQNLPNAMDRKWAAAHVKMASNYFLGCALFCILFPGSLGVLKYVAPFLFLTHLAQRGREPVARGPDGMAGEVRGPVYADYVWALLILSFHFAIGAIIAELLVPIIPLLRPRQTRFLITTGSLALADVLWQPHLIEKGPVKKKR